MVLQRRIGDGFPASEIREAESGGIVVLAGREPAADRWQQCW